MRELFTSIWMLKRGWGQEKHAIFLRRFKNLVVCSSEWSCTKMKQSITWENINDSCMTRELTWQVRDPDKNPQTTCKKPFVSKFIPFGKKLWFWQGSSLQQRYFNQLTSMLNSPLLILHLTSSSVLGCNARTAAINSPENCSIVCRCNDSNAGICVRFLSGCDDASWLEKRGTCNKAPLKLSSQCVHEAAGNLVITSKSIFTFSLSWFRWVYHLPRGLGRGAFLHLALEKGERRDRVLLLC